MYLASNTVRGWSEETEAWEAADWAAQETWQLAQRCGKGLRDIMSVSLSHFPFFFFLTLLPSFSLYRHNFPQLFFLSRTHFYFFSHTLSLCLPQSSILSPTFSFFSHSYFLYLPLQLPSLSPVYFLSLTLSFSPPSGFLLSPHIHHFCLTHTHPFLSLFHFDFLSIQFSFLFLLHTLISLSLTLIFHLSFTFSSPPTFNLFPHVFTFSLTHTLFLSLSPPHTFFLSHTFTLSHSFTFTLLHTKSSLLHKLPVFPL